MMKSATSGKTLEPSCVIVRHCAMADENNILWEGGERCAITVDPAASPV